MALVEGAGPGLGGFWVIGLGLPVPPGRGHTGLATLQPVSTTWVHCACFLGDSSEAATSRPVCAALG